MIPQAELPLDTPGMVRVEEVEDGRIREYLAEQKAQGRHVFSMVCPKGWSDKWVVTSFPKKNSPG